MPVPIPHALLTLEWASFLSDNGYRECLANGSWAARVNYSQCQEILSEEVGAWEPLVSWQEGKRHTMEF